DSKADGKAVADAVVLDEADHGSAPVQGRTVSCVCRCCPGIGGTRGNCRGCGDNCSGVVVGGTFSRAAETKKAPRFPGAPFDSSVDRNSELLPVLVLSIA